ncbi:MAG: phenylalanine--tRNA ligase subunit beta, partial [Candidatus Omnitrophica bacterium]|nr:phenylalanine--tRNA ligase subunit beta [Candidatus Omnitrophota bacterium]
MTLSWQWLKQYVTVRLTPQQAAERLTLAGLEITDRRVVSDDTRFACEVTPNRPDWLSHFGVARELAAITGSALKGVPAAREVPSVRGPRPTITIKDRKACRRYVGLMIEGVTVGPSPAHLRQRLEAIGVRSLNNVVDVTNFVLHELGQPLHAFNADRLAKGRIVVRRAVAGESLTTIDGVARTLDPSILVIADAERPVAIAGIMGGQATEVTTATTRILLESAWFDPLVTRRASRALGLASDSSYRFERGIDFEQTVVAARRAAAMIIEVAGGHLVGGLVDRRGARPAATKPIMWNPAEAAALGATIPATWQRQRFERLECRVSGSGARWRVTPPSFRADLNRPADLLEELARLWGYDRLPSTLPRPDPLLAAVGSPEGSAPWVRPLRVRECELRDLLIAAGLDETLTYSLISPAELQRLPWTDPVLSLRNPLSQDRRVLRPTLVVGALETVARNLNRRAPGVAVFELGRTYHGTDGSPEERRRLIVALAGLRPSSWDAKPGPWDVFHAKGILDTLSERLIGKPLSWNPITPNVAVGAGAAGAPPIPRSPMPY